MMGFGDFGSRFSRGAIPFAPSRGRVAVREPAQADELSDLLGAFMLRLLRRNVPYALRSAGSQAAYEFGKRALDIVVALTLLLLIAPLLTFIAICIKVTSPGPVFFWHRRLTRGGKEFWCCKFRTMVADAEEQLRRDARLRKQFEARYKVKNDPRVTPLGAFLRKTSLDELPQLFHVLIGEMTLIGPRPIVKPELTRYGIYHSQLLAVRPGLGGLWQACGRSETSYGQRVQLDMAYIDHRCLSLDLLLLLLTGVSVFTRRGAC